MNVTVCVYVSEHICCGSALTCSCTCISQVYSQGKWCSRWLGG